MSDQPELPGVGPARPSDAPVAEEPLAEGMAWFITPEGTRVQGRPKCVVRGAEIEACFTLQSLLGWFSLNARTRLYIGTMVHRGREGQREALVLDHGAKAADLGWCPCCGAELRTHFAWEASS